MAAQPIPAPVYINPYRLFVGSFIPNWLMRMGALSPGAKLCYARLCQYAGEDGAAYPSQTALAQEIGVCERQCRRYVKELVDACLIEEEQRGRMRSNLYRFLSHPAMFLGGPVVSDRTDVSKSDRTIMSESDRTDVSSGERTDVSSPIGRESGEDNHSEEKESPTEVVLSAPPTFPPLPPGPPVAEISDAPPPKPKTSQQVKYDLVLSLLTSINSAMGVPAPTKFDVTREMRPSSRLLPLLEAVGGDTAKVCRMFAVVHKTWKASATAETIYTHRHKILTQLDPVAVTPASVLEKIRADRQAQAAHSVAH